MNPGCTILIEVQGFERSFNLLTFVNFGETVGNGIFTMLGQVRGTPLASSPFRAEVPRRCTFQPDACVTSGNRLNYRALKRSLSRVST